MDVWSSSFDGEEAGIGGGESGIDGEESGIDGGESGIGVHSAVCWRSKSINVDIARPDFHEIVPCEQYFHSLECDH